MTRPTSLQQVNVIEFGKRHNTTDTMDFCLRPIVTDLSFMLWTCRLCCGLVADLLWGSRQIVTGLLQGKWCNGSKALNELQQQHPSNIDALQLA